MVDFLGNALVISGDRLSAKEIVPVLKFRSGMIFVVDPNLLELLRIHIVPSLPMAAILKNF